MSIKFCKHQLESIDKFVFIIIIELYSNPEHHHRCVQTIEPILGYYRAHRVAKTKRSAPNGAIEAVVCTTAFRKRAALNPMAHVGLSVDFLTVATSLFGTNIKISVDDDIQKNGFKKNLISLSLFLV